MDNLLVNGDMVLTQSGDTQSIRGVEEIIQQAMISLLVKKGKFPLDPELGSELESIDIHNVDDFTLLSIITEALSKLSSIKVVGIEKNIDYPQQILYLSVYLKIDSKDVTLELNNTMWR